MAQNIKIEVVTPEKAVVEEDEHRHELEPLRVAQVQLRHEHNERRARGHDGRHHQHVVGAARGSEEEEAHCDHQVEQHERVHAVAKEMENKTIMTVLSLLAFQLSPETQMKCESTSHFNWPRLGHQRRMSTPC